MSNLFRVIRAEVWAEAQKNAQIPRCGNDDKLNRIHLNLPEAVEFVAAKYFAPEEQPLALEIDVSSFADQIEWLEPTEQLPWRQPLAAIEQLPLSSIVKVHQLEYQPDENGRAYRLV